MLIRTLTYHGTEWKRLASNVTHFPASGLKPNCKVWHYFILAKMIPSSNTSEITKEWTLLNCAIQEGYSIDVDKVIHNSILRILVGSATGSLGHPSLIHDLCIQEGVPMQETDEVLHPRQPLMRDIRDRRVGHQDMPGSSRPSLPTAPPQSTNTTGDILQHLETMDLHMIRWQDGMQVQMNQLQFAIYDQFQHQNACMEVLASAHLELTFPAPSQFPPHSYPPAPPGGEEDS